MHTTKEIANYFLALVDEDAGDSLSNLKLQKLLYYAQGVYLAIFDTPLFSEAIEAWEHGPVVPCLYHFFKQHGADPIRLAKGINLDSYSLEVKEVLDEVYSVYGQFSASKLRNLTHEEAPWKKTPQGEIIPISVMKDYFQTQLV